ncbi:uncharacterized protein LOC141718712 [Apium graveolens]|uniref:uncharacterized protein LOC141718712 n=1 Tax=Apium graveolens TaxID=4045 RepID=UPI003D7B3B2A
MDAKYPEFSSEPRNVRLGITTDGFNPFRKMSATHSTWPIIVVNYNLPPWLNMKPENLILSTIIPGPNNLGNNTDVYMQLLIEELKELCKTGVETYDAATNQKFTLRASVLRTISDFPGYAIMSGWSTKGKLACLVCHYETSSMYLKHRKKSCYMNLRKFLDPNHKWRFDKRRFNGEVETGTSAPMLTGRQVAEILDGYENSFGGVGKKRKNICDSVLGTLLNIGGKTEDHLAARLDLQDQGIRKALHPMPSADGKHLEFRAAKFDMTNKEKEIFCSVLENAKFPYGFASNISKCVQDRKVTGYKSHDAHEIQYGGLVQQIWMYFIERYLGVLKKYARVLNYDDKEVEDLIEKHHKLLDSNLENIAKSKRYKTEKTHTDIVCEWFRSKISKKINVSREVPSLAKGPRQQAKRYSGYVVNGYRFHTEQRDRKCTTQNSGVFLTALTTSFASLKDTNPLVGEVSYYGSIQEILEIDYWGAFRVVLVRCAWYKDDKDSFGFTRVNFNRDGHRQCESSIAPQWRIHEDQLNYKEIGGLYVNRRGWTLVTDDQGVTEVTRDKSDVSFYIDNKVD